MSVQTLSAYTSAMSTSRISSELRITGLGGRISHLIRWSTSDILLEGEKSQEQNVTESVPLKHPCNICLDYEFLALFKYILLITYSSTGRFRDEFSAESQSKIL